MSHLMCWICVVEGSGSIVAQSSTTFAEAGGPTVTNFSVNSTTGATLAATGSSLMNPPWPADALS